MLTRDDRRRRRARATVMTRNSGIDDRRRTPRARRSARACGRSDRSTRPTAKPAICADAAGQRQRRADRRRQVQRGDRVGGHVVEHVGRDRPAADDQHAEDDRRAGDARISSPSTATANRCVALRVDRLRQLPADIERDRRDEHAEEERARASPTRRAALATGWRRGSARAAAHDRRRAAGCSACHAVSAARFSGGADSSRYVVAGPTSPPHEKP